MGGHLRHVVPSAVLEIEEADSVLLVSQDVVESDVARRKRPLPLIDLLVDVDVEKRSRAFNPVADVLDSRAKVPLDECADVTARCSSQSREPPVELRHPSADVE